MRIWLGPRLVFDRACDAKYWRPREPAGHPRRRTGRRNAPMASPLPALPDWPLQT